MQSEQARSVCLWSFCQKGMLSHGGLELSVHLHKMAKSYQSPCLKPVPLSTSFKLFPQPLLCQHCSVVIANSKAGWSMEMLNKAGELLLQRMCKTRFASRSMPLQMPAETVAVTFQSNTTPSIPSWLLCQWVVFNSEFLKFSSRWSCFLRNERSNGFSFSETENQQNP